MSLRTWLLLLLIVAVAAGTALGQAGARIEGTVQDPTGAVVPNAKVTAVNDKTQLVKEATSNAEGLFVIPAVPPGTYTITAEAQGFAKQVLHNQEVNVAGIVSVNFKLKVGSSNETVEVAASSVTVQTTDSQKSGAITLKDINTLPSLGRTPITLAIYQPGTQIDPSDASFTRINGTRQGSNNSTLDGIDVNDSVVPRLGLSMTANNMDSVGEFRIVTSGGKAEYGRSAGGQVEMITRSGTNDFHGNAYDYVRNTDLNANEYFSKQSGLTRPKFIQNMFGGSFGGPIFHNKTFFFGNYQGRRTRQETVRNRTVYLANARNGIFTYASGGVNQTYNIVANDPRGLGFSPQVKAIIAMTPPSNNTDVGDGLNTGGYRFNQPANSFEDQFTVRGDHNLRDNNKVFLRWSWQRNSSIDTLNSADSPFPGGLQGSQGGHRWGYSVGDDWTLTSTMVNEFRWGHQSAAVAFVRPQRPQAAEIIPNTITNPVYSAFAQGRNSPVDDFIDNVTKTWHDHIFKFGGKFSHTVQDGYNYAGTYPNISLSSTGANTAPLPGPIAALSSSQQSLFQALYNNVFGRINTVSSTFYSTDLATWQAAGSPRMRDYVLNEHGYYVQDDWRVRRNLTLNLGLRWELYLPPNEKNGIQGAVVDAGQITPTNTNTAVTLQRSSNWYKTDWNNFAPRFGFAWDVKGDGKTAIRGNYGIFYDRMIGSVTSLADGNTPGFSTGASTIPQAYTLADIAANNCGSAPVGDVRVSDCMPAVPQPAAPQLTPPITASGKNNNAVVMFNPNLRTGYVESYNLNIQREILRNTILEVGYVGNRGKKLFMDLDYDQKGNAAFLQAFKEEAAFAAAGYKANTTASLPAASNPFIAIFQPYKYSNTKTVWWAPTAGATCSAQPNPALCAGAAAIYYMGSSTFTTGQVGVAADTVDINLFPWYAQAGLPLTYLQRYPQFYDMVVGTNAGVSYYDSLQVSLRRYAGALRMAVNYTYSKSLDNISVDGNGFTSPMDNFNPASNKGYGDYDFRHSMNGSFMYTLPVGRGKMLLSHIPSWVDSLIGGWDLGGLLVVQGGPNFSISSGRYTFSNMRTSYMDYTGPKQGSIQKNADGSVYWFTTAQSNNLAYPAAGTFGNSGRNGFVGPGYFNIDTSLVKKFKITESHSMSFRWEAYNMLNHANFSLPNVDYRSLFTSTFGKIGNTRNPRIMQMTLRYEF